MTRGMTLLETAYVDHAHGCGKILSIITPQGVFEDDLSYYFSTYRSFFTIEKILLRFVRGKTLDIGAGPGRISRYLQGKKIDVTPLDLSPVMKDLAEQNNVHSYKIGNAFSLSLPDKFDTVLLMGNTIGICTDREDLKKLFSSCAAHMAPNGQLLCTATDPTEFGFASSTLISGILHYNELSEPFAWFIAGRADIETAAEISGLRLDLIEMKDGLAGFVFTKHR